MSRGWKWVPGAVSVIIVCYNRLDLTKKCYESILNTGDPVHEVIFVDNASTDGTAEWIEKARGMFRMLQIESLTMTQNVGWGRGANAGAQLAEGEYLMQLNNDTEVSPGWLRPLVDEMADPEVGAAAGRLINPDGTLQHAGIKLFYDEHETLTAQNIAEEQPAGDVDCQAGTAQLVRADAWQEVGGINHHYRNGYEDVDFCLRLRNAGWRLRYNPASTVMHHQHGSGPERWTHVHDNIAQLNHDWRPARGA